MSVLERARRQAGRSVKRYLARHRTSVPLRKGVAICRSLVDGYNNVDYDMETNGEYWVLSALDRWPLSCFIDAGANIGKWTVAVKRYFPQATVHSFEIHPQTFAALSGHINGLTGVNIVNSGLSDRIEDVQLHCFGNQSELTSAFMQPYFEDLPRHTIAGHAVSGDSYVSRESIGRVDFLKIDVEGMEEKVLRGFEETIRREAIDVIQFEYGIRSVFTHFLLHDFYVHLESRGYAVGKIFPGGVDFRPYAVSDENFQGPNYLACRKAKPEYIQRLASRPRLAPSAALPSD
ncbi:MAG: FkbM family methyltransferase [Bryobacteraceae bacterium]|jgi:FkbM family methyltransferase